MIPVSSNSFSKKSFQKSTNAFTDKSTSTSGNSMTKKDFTEGAPVWEGTNTSDAGLGDDLYSPSLFGVNEAGGIAHFKNVTQPVITH